MFHVPTSRILFKKLLGPKLFGFDSRADELHRSMVVCNFLSALLANLEKKFISIQLGGAFVTAVVHDPTAICFVNISSSIWTSSECLSMTNSLRDISMESIQLSDGVPTPAAFKLCSSILTASLSQLREKLTHAVCSSVAHFICDCSLIECQLIDSFDPRAPPWIGVVRVEIDSQLDKNDSSDLSSCPSSKPVSSRWLNLALCCGTSIPTSGAAKLSSNPHNFPDDNFLIHRLGSDDFDEPSSLQSSNSMPDDDSPRDSIASMPSLRLRCLHCKLRGSMSKQRLDMLASMAKLQMQLEANLPPASPASSTALVRSQSMQPQQPAFVGILPHTTTLIGGVATGPKPSATFSSSTRSSSLKPLAQESPMIPSSSSIPGFGSLNHGNPSSFCSSGSIESIQWIDCHCDQSVNDFDRQFGIATLEIDDTSSSSNNRRVLLVPLPPECSPSDWLQHPILIESQLVTRHKLIDRLLMLHAIKC